ncbi:MAG TPA: geranylgeranyl reductase family protein [Actinopolymorphaceae bacterium]|jgi:geranylgeranyl reductase family protein
MSRQRSNDDADVIVVGAGPAGATTAYHLARTGLDVMLVEKTAFPREKVCGDGLTPRAVKALVKMGIDTSPEAGWLRNHGLRIYGGGMRLQLPWPDLAAFPSYGLVRKRTDFDEMLARHAQKAGARLHELTTVTGPVVDERTGRIVGVTAKSNGSGEETTYRARIVVAADGNSSRLSVAVGRNRRDDRPMGVAVRTYFRSPRHDDDWLESWLELWDGEPGKSNLLPGYGWVFGMGDGTSNVGLGLLNTSSKASHRTSLATSHASGTQGRAREGNANADLRGVLKAWLGGLPPEWQFSEEHQVGPVRGAALPMGFNRQPHYSDGLLLVGDAGGMVNPFNGEGIAYAMESAELAADVIAQALARPAGPQRERALASYPRTLKQLYGGYYTLGRLFVKAIGDPRVMKLATRHGLPRPLLMRFTLKLLANLTDPRGGDAFDRIINAMCKIAPAA